MPDEKRYNCGCGQPGLCEIIPPDPPVITTELPYGRYPCRQHYNEYHAWRLEQIAEWLGYFK